MYIKKTEYTMTDEDRDQLLQDLLGDDGLNQLRQTSLSRGLKEMRRRRQRSVAARISVIAFPVLLLAVVAFYPWFQQAKQSPAPTALAFSSKAESKVEYITADQLFALFPNRPMALVGKPGHQQLIFLDKPSASDNE
jgi:hypothetical protein